VLGLDELATRLERARHEGRQGVAVSFATSLDRLDPVELLVLGVLAVGGAPVDQELLDALEVPGTARDDVAGAAAALVRDGLVRRTPGTHGHAVFHVAANVAAQVLDRMVPTTRGTLEQALVRACAATFHIDQFLWSQMRTVEQSQRWMALMPLAQHANGLARRHGMSTEGAVLGVAVHELLVEDGGSYPDPDRFAWPLESPDLSWGLRADVHAACGMAWGYVGQPERAADHLDRGVALARAHEDLGRVAVLQVNRLIALDLSPGPELDRVVSEARDAAERSGNADVFVGGHCVRILAPRSRPMLEKGLRLRRAGGHAGSHRLARANLADTMLETGQLDDAERYAVEGGALAAEMHQPYMVDAMASTLEAVRAIGGDDDSTREIAGLLARAWQADDVRTATDATLKLAAAALHSGEPDTAADALGLYDALLTHYGVTGSFTESGLVDTWLTECPRVPVRTSLDGAVLALVARFRPSGP
jgi:hypothetical protein